MSAPAATPPRNRRRRDQEPSRDKLLQFWLDVVRFRPPAERVAWLEDVSGRLALGVPEAKAVVVDIERRHRRDCRVACSGGWAEHWYRTGTEPPFRTPSEGHPRLKRSRASTGYGDEEPTRRWTPLANAESEDALDLLNPGEAEAYHHPPSPSAVAIFIEVTYGRRGGPGRKSNGSGRTRSARRREKIASDVHT